MSPLLLILVVLLLIGVFPVFPYNRGWGYGPIGILVLVLIVLLVLGVIPVHAQEWSSTNHRDPEIAGKVWTEEEGIGTVPDIFAPGFGVRMAQTFEPQNPGRVVQPIRVIDGDTVAR